jgi:phosphate starvation-inducible protein PhoH and related proteins
MTPLPESAELFYGLELTDEQKRYVDAIFDKQIVFVNAKAGTGKTTLAVGAAKILDMPLVYTFSPVEEGAMGFSPGTVEEKERKYITPLVNALGEIREDPRFAIKSENNPEIINKNAWVTAQSHVFLRGSNIKDSFVIIDEAQNLTRGELKKVLTRIHDTSKVVVIGHDGQIDLKRPEKSGFVPYLDHFRNEPYAEVVELTKNFRGALAQKADELTW